MLSDTHMQLTRTTGRLPIARVLALVALLCASALQVQEAAHNHGLDLHDSYTQCLVCKSSGPAVIALEITAVGDPANSGIVATAVTPAPRVVHGAPFLARGPPLYT